MPKTDIERQFRSSGAILRMDRRSAPPRLYAVLGIAQDAGPFPPETDRAKPQMAYNVPRAHQKNVRSMAESQEMGK